MPMRTPRTTLALAAIALVCALAAPAVAQGPPQETGGGAAPEERTNATARQEAMQARVAEMRAAREAILAGFHANRSAILSEYHASLNATRESFLAAKADVLAACNETRSQSNESGAEERAAHAKCVSDGLRPLIAEARAKNAEARELAHQKLADERAKGMSAWGKARAEAEARAEARTAARADGA